MKLVIDTDPGTDDCAALTLLTLLTKVVAITTVFGNSSLNQTSINACRILEYLKVEDIPVYKGARNNLSAKIDQIHSGSECHGSDALNDVPHIIPSITMKQPETDINAVDAIIYLAKKFPGELTFVALGPLTNFALAFKHYPELPTLMKSLYIMGSSSKKGNVTPWAEFNFHSDALSANIVLNHFCKYGMVHMVPWETCLENIITFNQFHSLFSDDNNNPASILLRATGMTPWLSEKEKSGSNEYVFSDQIVAMLLLHPESAIETQHYDTAEVNYDDKDPKYGLTEYVRLKDTQKTDNGLIVYTKFNMDYMIASYKKVISHK